MESVDDGVIEGELVRVGGPDSDPRFRRFALRDRAENRFEAFMEDAGRPGYAK